MTAKSELYIAFSLALGIPLAQVTEALAFNSIEKWDSVAHMTLVAELENRFNIMLDTDDIIDMSSVAKSAEILSRYGVVWE